MLPYHVHGAAEAIVQALNLLRCSDPKLSVEDIALGRIVNPARSAGFPDRGLERLAPGLM